MSSALAFLLRLAAQKSLLGLGRLASTLLDFLASRFQTLKSLLLPLLLCKKRSLWWWWWWWWRRWRS
jgi:hypothetical protein